MKLESESTPSLDLVLQQIWEDLDVAVESASDSYHTAVVANRAENGPAARTVVLRGVNRARRELIFNTDARSPKYAQLESDPALEWLFYDRDRKVQIRASGRCETHRQDELTREKWRLATSNSRWCYTANEGPGSPVAKPDVVGHERDGYPNFVVVRSEIERLDWLYLRAGGHLRCQFQWLNDNWSGHWVAP